MTERIDNLFYELPSRSSTREPLETNLFLTQPGEFLVETVASQLRSTSVWAELFSAEAIESYDRMDFSMRDLPAMRIYVDEYVKNAETWYENGDVLIDMIWPASIRRNDLTRLPSTVAGAMIQQLRSDTFFEAIAAKVPGLNELGKIVRANFNLVFKYENDLFPLTRLTVNYRILLAEWDEYAESDYRTKDEPFARTLEDLKRIVTTIKGLEEIDPDDSEVEIQIDQET